MNKTKYTHTVDTERFSADISEVMNEYELTMRSGAVEIGISPATLNRLCLGGMPDLISYYKVCLWLGVEMEFYIIKVKK